MKDYVARRKATGALVPIAKVPTDGIFRMIGKAERVNRRKVVENNPGVTVEAFLQRLRLELDIRSLGLGEID